MGGVGGGPEASGPPGLIWGLGRGGDAREPCKGLNLAAYLADGAEAVETLGEARAGQGKIAAVERHIAEVVERALCLHLAAEVVVAPQARHIVLFGRGVVARQPRDLAQIVRCL